MKRLAKLCIMAACVLWAGTPAMPQGWHRGEPVPARMPVSSAKTGNPLYDMPDGQVLISAFGERPVFSPDGSKIAFIGKSYGDAFEYDMKTGTTRNLTAHSPHHGILRVQYLADGSFLLLTPRFPAATREETRFSRVEMFWMDAQATRAPMPLGKTVFEGIATSAKSNLIGWSEIAIDRTQKTAPSTTVYTGKVVVAGGKARLIDQKTVIKTSECLSEAQDFVPGDKAMTMPCYTYGKDERSEVRSVELATGRVTRYPTRPDQYSEVEGLFPDGKRTLVECADDRKKGMDLCVLDLNSAAPRYTRLTNIVQYGPYKYGNPVVRFDGRMIAAQIGPADVADAGVGEGIVLIELAKDF